MSLSSRRAAAAALLHQHEALLAYRPDVAIGSDDRVDDGVASEAQAPIDETWAAWLRGLDDEHLAHLETAGVAGAWADAPPSLRTFVDDVIATTALPALLDAVPCSPARRHERPRKQAQIDAFAQLVHARIGEPRRVVDVGSGHGHLTRALAAALRRPTIGLERDPRLAEHARRLAADDDRADVDATFVVSDVLHDALVVDDGDCLVGLHACGELGDIACRAVATSTSGALVFVGCCLQKQRAPVRTPLVDDGARLAKPLLGLSNLTTRDDGVEASRADNIAGRTRRIALRQLLSQDGVTVRVRAELEGLNRRRAHATLDELVAAAYAHRALPLPSSSRLASAEREATALHAQWRRSMVPRMLLARVIEVFVALDRATFLHQHGCDVDVGVVFPADVSPRNIALVARRP
ncbi:MAG TPA: methyltransferase [Myxococcota bacterium]